MTLSSSIKRKRNQQITQMLRDKFGIIVESVSQDQIEQHDWFIPMRNKKGELKLVYK